MNNNSEKKVGLSVLSGYSELNVNANIDNKACTVKAMSLVGNTLYLLDSFFSGSLTSVEECTSSLDINDLTFNTSVDKIVYCKGRASYDVVGAGLTLDTITFSNKESFLSNFDETIKV